MKSGAGVLLVSACQMVVGLVILGIYEGWKTHYINDRAAEVANSPPSATDSLGPYSVFSYSSSPLAWLFWISIVNNVFSVVGFAGLFARLRQLVVSFFVYNLANVVISFHAFVDVASTVHIKHNVLGGYERAAAAFLFFDFILSCLACVFAVKAIDELKEKKREETTLRHNIDMGLPL